MEHKKVANLFIGAPLITKEELDAKFTSHNETGNGSKPPVEGAAMMSMNTEPVAAPIESGPTSYYCTNKRHQKGNVKLPMTQRLESEVKRLIQQKEHLISLIHKVLDSEVEEIMK